MDGDPLLTPSSDRRPPSVLLVDDRAANLVALEALLEPLVEEHRVRLVRAMSGESALRAVLHEDFAVILLDVQMPGIDGVETARLIKARTTSRHVPIIFLTAIDRDRRRVTEGYLSGAVDYLTKPFEPDALRAKVAAFIELWEKRTDEAYLARRRYADRAERAAAALASERARLDTVLDQLPVGVIIGEAPTGRMVHLNASVQRIIGHATPSASIADYSADWGGMHRSGRALTSPEWPLARAILYGEVITGQEVVYRRPDGREVIVSCNAAPVRDAATDEILAGVVVFDDVTERRLADMRLERLYEVTTALAGALTTETVAKVVAERGTAAVGAVAGALYLAAPEGDALVVAGIEGYSAASAREFERIPVSAPLPLTDALRMRRPVLLNDRTERLTRYPHLEGADGEVGAEAWVAMPLVIGERVLGVLGLSFATPRLFAEAEVSFMQALATQAAIALERAAAYDAERRARAAAEEANRAKSQFLATMSHELRTPLNAIRGYAQLLDMGLRGPVTPEQRSDLARIQQSEQHLVGIIGEILEFARIDAARVELAPRDVPLGTLADEVAAFIAPQLHGKRIVFERETPESPGPVAHADPDKTRQVLINLLSNAVKATAEGGRIAISARTVGSQAVVGVHDTGVGIPADKLDEIFEPFVQLGRELHAPMGGTGLGLSISRGLVRAMGGELTATSAPGVGSTFTFTLPLAKGNGNA